MIPDLHKLTRRRGVRPNQLSSQGDRRAPTARPQQHDLWLYKVSLQEDAPLPVPSDESWNVFRPRRDSLLERKKQLTVDVSLGYRTTCQTAGGAAPPSEPGDISGTTDPIRAFDNPEVAPHLKLTSSRLRRASAAAGRAAKRNPSRSALASDSHLPVFRIELFDCALGKIVCGGNRLAEQRARIDKYQSAADMRPIGASYAINTDECEGRG